MDLSKLTMLQTVILRNLVRERRDKLAAELRMMRQKAMSEMVISNQEKALTEIKELWAVLENKGDVTEEVPPDQHVTFSKRTPLRLSGSQAIDVDEN